MKKYLLMFWLLAIIISLCSCGGVRGVIFDDSDKKADARLEQIIEILNNEDKEVLKAMFSKQALSEANDFNGNLNALFNYIEGDIQSWESTGAYGGSEDINADGTGNRKKEVESTYVLTTSKQEYEIAIYECTIDTANPKNVGVYSFCIINSKDNKEPDFVYWGNGEAGINIG